MRRTKIVATVGPACDSESQLRALISAGVNVFRLNFSHGEASEHAQRAQTIRQLAIEMDTAVAVLADLQGPKIRLRSIACDQIQLSIGQSLTLDTAIADGEGDSERVGVDYEPLARSVQVGDTLLLDDGRLQLSVTGIDGTAVHCRSESNGVLHSRKGINRLGGGLSAPALTEKDLADMDTIAALGLDYVAISFPSCAEDVLSARNELEKRGCRAALIAKVERAEAVADEETLDDIILAADGVMVARGDLGVEIGDAHLIGLQKYLIKRARVLNRVVITATQMMESMIQSPVPTRAEVFDVANAVLDGTDAVMLSAETATGANPVAVVEAMSRTCVGAEQYPSTRKSGHRMDREFETVDETIAMSAMYAANHLKGVKALVALTETGRTPLLMSRLSSGLPIYALSRHASTVSRMALCRGVCGLSFDITNVAGDVEAAVIERLRARSFVETGDLILLTSGDNVGVDGNTNTLRILRV